jgi:hypothetical protein
MDLGLTQPEVAGRLGATEDGRAGRSSTGLTQLADVAP